MKPSKLLYILAILVFSLTCINRASADEPVWDANLVELESKKLADGVYAYFPSDAEEKAPKGLPIATSGGFIVGDNGVLIIDTMLNKRLYLQVIALVRAVTDRPIRYALNTSFHGDHSYGNMYLPSETSIIQHVNTRAYVNEHFKADTEFMIQNFGTGRGIEEITAKTGDILVPKGGSISIDLGGKVLEVIDFGFAQTGGDLFVWEPESKVLWTGNPVIAQKPSLTWLLDGHLLETLKTLKKVYDFLPVDARVVPGHGPVMGREELTWHIDYLSTVKKEVRDAIERGLTLEETVEEVKMEEFRGYALFDWVHPALNIPAAYRDLKK